MLCELRQAPDCHYDACHRIPVGVTYHIYSQFRQPGSRNKQSAGAHVEVDGVSYGPCVDAKEKRYLHGVVYAVAAGEIRR